MSDRVLGRFASFYNPADTCLKILADTDADTGLKPYVDTDIDTDMTLMPILKPKHIGIGKSTGFVE